MVIHGQATAHPRTMIYPIRKAEITTADAGAWTTIWEHVRPGPMRSRRGYFRLTFLVTNPGTSSGIMGSSEAVDLFDLHDVLADRIRPPLAVAEPRDHQHLNPSTNPGESAKAQGKQKGPANKWPAGIRLELQPDPTGHVDMYQLRPAEPVEVHPGGQKQEQHHPYDRAGVQDFTKPVEGDVLDLVGTGARARDLGGLNREWEGHRSGGRGGTGRRGR